MSTSTQLLDSVTEFTVTSAILTGEFIAEKFCYR